MKIFQHKPIFAIIFFLLLVATPAQAQNVFNSNGQQVNTSEWLQSGKKPQSDNAPNTTVEDVVESQKDNDQTALPEQLPMSERSVTEGRGYSDKIFSSEEIQNSHTTNLNEFFQEQGLLVMQSGGAGAKSEVSFKGFTAFCIKVYVDGILANNPATGEFDWNSIDIASIESIRISEIPELGGAEFAGCSIFITTKNGKNSILRTESSVSSYEKNAFDGLFQSVNYSSNIKNFFYRIGAVAFFADNEYSIPDAKRNLFNFSKQGNFNFSWNAKANEKINLHGSNILAYNSLKVFGTGDSLKTGIEQDYTTQHNVALNLQLEKMKLKTSLAYFYGQVDYFENRTPAKDSIQTTNSQSIELRQTMNWIFDATLAYKEEHLFSGNGDRHRIDFGASKTFAFNENRFLITPCVQFLTWGGGAENSEKWQFAALPRLTINIFDFYVSGYRIFTLPTFNQLYYEETAWSSGNPDLKPEDGWAATVGFKRQGFPVYARFTYSYYANKISWGAAGYKWIPLNTTDADYFVGTVGYEQEVWKNHLLLKADSSVTKARLRENKNQIMWVPQFQIHAAAAFRYAFFGATLDYSYTGKRYTSNENTESYPGFHLLDLGVDFKANPEFTVYAKATNLLDEQVAFSGSYYMPSRKYTIGMKFEK